MRVIGVIPARYGSKRFPGKVLAGLGGKPLIQHVYENAARAKELAALIVATDDERVMQACRAFGARAQRTSSKHASGTDRVAEIAGSISGDVFVNIQGDEPQIDPEMISQLVGPFTDEQVHMTTLKSRIRSEEELRDPNVVKVVTDRRGDALYFSRAAIPFRRDGAGDDHFRHIGLYAYRKDLLLSFSRMSESVLEQTERLEQLRVLWHGHRIRVLETSHRTLGVDTPADLEELRKTMERPLV